MLSLAIRVLSNTSMEKKYDEPSIESTSWNSSRYFSCRYYGGISLLYLWLSSALTNSIPSRYEPRGGHCGEPSTQLSGLTLAAIVDSQRRYHGKSNKQSCDSASADLSVCHWLILRHWT